MDRRKINQIVPALLKWYDANARDLPWRRNVTPYATWISEIMLQQTQVNTVIPYFERWMKALPSLPAFGRARPQAVLKLWEGLGYYSRVRNAQTAARLIMDRNGGEFPGRFDDILALPGIGRYTAGAIASIAFNQPTPILDGNVIRVLCRVFGIVGEPRERTTNAALWNLAEELVRVDTDHCSALNQSLMELGALICTPRQPKCLLCPLQKLCFAFQQNRVEEFPMLEPRAKATERRFIAFVARKEDRFLVRRRPDGVVNANLWEFPNVETASGVGADAQFQVTADKPLCTIRHSITRYRISLEAYPATASLDAPGVWKTIAQLNRLPFTSAHRKILTILANPQLP